MRHNLFSEHPNEDQLEEYAFHRLPEPQTEALEEHLLLCGRCQDRLRAVDEYILLMKTAAGEIAQPAPRRHWAMPWNPRLVAAIAGLAAVLVAGFLFLLPGATGGTPVRVELVAYRGAEMARAPAKRRVDLTIDASDLPRSPGYRIQVVDQTGKPEWSGPATGAQAKLVGHVSRSLAYGVHWVRVFSEQGELLREFGLRVE
jgi:hypothetical protein